MTELIWDGKYDQDGRKVAPLRVSLPFQTVESVNESVQQRQIMLDLFSSGRDPQWRNRLIWGDKKYILPSLLDEFASMVNLIYIDPPFNVGADFSFTATIADHPDDQDEDKKVTFLKQPNVIEQKAYRDTWGKGINSYLQWFYETSVFLKELMAPNASLYVHLDWHVIHYVKAILDEIIGVENFRNEIVWKRANTHNDPNGYGRIHDTLLYYAFPNSTFNIDYSEYDEEYLETAYRHEDEDGRRYRLLPLHSTHVFSTKDDNTRRFADKILRPPSGKYWRWSQKKIDEAMEAGLIILSVKNIPQYKKYLDEAKGVPAQSIWDELKSLNRIEMVGYPTQKPESLLNRIISASSNEGDLVLDCFCGSGTTAAVAEKLNRRWIACDLSRFAIHTTRKRLLGIEGVKPFVVQNLGKYERQAWQSTEFQPDDLQARYREFILKLYHAQPIHGYTWLHGLKAGHMVHISGVDSPVTVGDVTAIVSELKRATGTGENAPTSNSVDVLGWDFAFELNEVARQHAALANVNLRFLRVPRDVMDKRAVEQGDIHFFELAALQVESKVKKLELELTLTDFVIPPDDVPEEVQKSIRHWSQWVDYWAVDWDYREDTFHNQWQTYRTRKNPDLQKSAKHIYEAAGEYTVVAKVIDILGNDTTRALKVEVK